MIRRLLVANRGEIARRVFRTCREMGIETVAVHSDPDSAEPFVLEADIAVGLPGSTPADTYLDITAIISAAKRAEVDAIHPGYGFLAENPEFAREVESAGLIWIGPPPEAMEIMGSKLASKQLMATIGVPLLPGVDLTGVADGDAVDAAAAIGFPLLVKASSGGGGKGMRIVDDPDLLAEAVVAARREAAAAFGDDTVFIEKYLVAPRHIEIQVFGDTHGRVISLFERECSIQRRHQKIIEEAPSPAIDEEMRRTMGAAAVRAGEIVGYVGAGTVEFLYQNGDFFFLEMNTRLQVEHPVTEMVTGLDLVRLQIEVANGAALDIEPVINGHAIEARLYAEDPRRGLLPVTGVIHRFEFPEQPGLRVDAGVVDGSTISALYDPLLAKVIAHGTTRTGAATLLASALRRAVVHGSITNRDLLVGIVEHPEFLDGAFDTHFLDRHHPSALAHPLIDEDTERLAAIAAALSDQADERQRAKVLGTVPSGWRNQPDHHQERGFRGAHGSHLVRYQVAGGYHVEGFADLEVGECNPRAVDLTVNGAAFRFEIARFAHIRSVLSSLGPIQLETIPRFPVAKVREPAGSIHAPMPGKVIRVGVEVGDEVSAGDILMVLEAMKMEHTLRSPHEGIVTGVECSPGDQVDAGATLVVVSQPGGRQLEVDSRTTST